MAKKFFLAVCTAFGLSFGFNYFFLNLTNRPLVDQALALFFLTAALAWVIHLAWSGAEPFHLRRYSSLSLNVGSLRENAPGLLLALFFFVFYLWFGSQMRDFNMRQVDNVFDSDPASWVHRIASPDLAGKEMRGPHPFAYFIFRPLGWFLNFFTRDPFLSAMLLNALAGGACVFLAWLFIKRQFQSVAYALLIAGLLGMSTSHLVLGSIVETYIFSAFALILFCVILQSNPPSLAPLVASGALTFGITLTNFVQNAIAFLVARPRWREIVRFAGWTVAIAFILTYLHAAWYPSSKPFFLMSGIQNEGKFFAELLDAPEWRIKGRILLLARTILLYTVVAPNFHVLREEVGSTLPELRFFKITPGTFHYGGYDGWGDALAAVWALLFLTAAVAFAWNLARDRKAGLSFAFALCLAFNFALHMIYGEEPFLYSPDWAYALVFFVAFGLSPFRNNRYFQAGFLTFLAVLAYHQWQFLRAVLQTLLPYMN